MERLEAITVSPQLYLILIFATLSLSPGVAGIIVKISRSFNWNPVRTQSTLVATWTLYEFWTREAEVLSVPGAASELSVPGSSSIAWKRLAGFDILLYPVNRLPALRGDRKRRYSIRINAQCKVCFEWPAGGIRDILGRDC